MLLILALEAAYLNGPPVPGEEMTFGRIRIDGRDLTPNATYTIVHPYGTLSLPADGFGAIRFTEDIGCAPELGATCNFDVALASNIGPFLVWDPAVLPAPPAGFIGDVNIPHPVVGSPTGNNLFRVTGPEGIIETNLFLVQGEQWDNPPIAGNDTFAIPSGATDRPLNVLANDRDPAPDGGAVRVGSIVAPGATNGGTAVVDASTLHINFGSSTPGTSTFQYIATSTGPGTDPQVATATVSVNVHAGNAAPVAVNDAVTVAPNGGIVTVNVLANDSDGNDPGLAPLRELINVSAVTQPVHGTVAIGAMGANVTYTPHAGFVGVDTFTYTVSDGLLTNIGTVTVTADNAPTATGDTFNVKMNSGVNVLNLLANDVDIDGQLITITGVTPPSSGSVTFNQLTGSVTYTPTSNLPITTTFNYTISDGILTSTGTVTINVIPNKLLLPFIGR
jgi:hypothetical protein